MSYYDDYDWGREAEEQAEIERGFEIEVDRIMREQEADDDRRRMADPQ